MRDQPRLCDCVGMSLVTLKVLIISHLVASPVQSSLLQRQLCQVSCDGVKTRPVCGSNGVTYRSRCELQEALCAGINVKFHHRGPCYSEADGSRCFEDKSSALRTGDESGIPIFVPECNTDGSYKQVQCHKGTGYCWCVNQDGKPVPGSSVQHNKPPCHLLLSTGRFRRGKRRKRPKFKNRSSTKKRTTKKICTQKERSTFSKNLLEMIGTEHSSMFGVRGRPNGTILGNAKKEVAEWKFEQLDEDRDGVLKRKELKKFRGNIKKVLHPRKCSRSFTRYCDRDEDNKISRKEWNLCIGIENISFNLFASLLSEEDEDRKQRDRKEKEQAEKRNIRNPLYEAGEQQDQASPPSLYSRQFGQDSEDAVKTSSVNKQQRKQNTDCTSARHEAMGAAKQGNLGLQIPECNAEGQYELIQCYKTEGYCWCVEQDTGKPIVGTGAKNIKPNCGGKVSQATIPRRSEWKKCEGKKRTVFLARLFDWMTVKMSNNSVPSYLFDTEPGLSLHQKVAKWQFIVLDVSRNGIIEKKEIKPWKKVLRKVPELGLCSKRIVQHCDSNRDKKISMQEWALCLGVAMDMPHDVPVGSPKRTVSERRGPNPLKTWLKAD